MNQIVVQRVNNSENVMGFIGVIRKPHIFTKDMLCTVCVHICNISALNKSVAQTNNQ